MLDLGVILALVLLGSGRDGDRPVDFETEVVPILTRAGCNTGACHGAAIGRGGFKLSLLGGDPAHDHEAIVDDLEGRRVNLAWPGRSLLLAKPGGRIDHEGGVRLDLSGEAAGRIVRWIEAGAPRGPARRLTHLAIEPTRTVVETVGSEVALRVMARFDDGPDEDVTRWTVFTPADPSALTLSRTPRGTVARVLREGPNVVVARYLDRVVPLTLIVPLGTSVVDLSAEPRRNLVDAGVLETLETLRLHVAPMADDATFLRRVRLDLTGRLPDIDEVRGFLADGTPSTAKRDRLVARLLDSDDFNTYWTFRLGTLFRVRPQGDDAEGAKAFHRWLGEQLARRTPFDAMARMLLTATGDSHRVGPANFYRVVGDARAQAEYAAEVFLGVRLQCANCHNHPLDRWTQDDYHGLAALFARVERGREVRLSPRGEVTHPRTGAAAVPKVPGARFLDPGEDGRTALADWLTEPGNPYFARAVVNRLWKALMGRGLVEPVDDLRTTNPATHPALLDALALDFEAHGHDLRHTLNLIATSATYGRSAVPVEGDPADDRQGAHALVRPLPAEVLADALADVTGVSDRYGSLPDGTRAIALIDPSVPSEALDLLGRCPRQDACDVSGPRGGGLAARLHLINGAIINRKVRDPAGRLHQAIAAGRADGPLVEEFYLRALGRRPSVEESAFWSKHLRDASSPAERSALLEDFLWSLLNCREFQANH